jgi:diguanylate cyclase
MLGTATGLESTYLTTIDLEAGMQHVQFARNAGEMQIPEGLDVPWSDTLCKRALDEGRMYTGDVENCWGDSVVARALGIQTYVSAPVRTQEGELLGTLCAASSSRKPLTPTAEPMLQLFSKLVGGWLERERLVAQLRTANATLANLALTDPLTGLPNRRAIVEELGRLLARAKREGNKVLVGLVDMDGFKAVNDTYGHQVGDQLLTEAARRMREALRATDLVGRIGGDEFAVLAPGPPEEEGAHEAAGLALQNRLSNATVGTYAIGRDGLNYGGASAGVLAIDPLDVDAEEALRLADARMYRVKQGRKQRAT